MLVWCTAVSHLLHSNKYQLTSEGSQSETIDSQISSLAALSVQLQSHWLPSLSHTALSVMQCLKSPN